jgi:hypothetical protein
VEKRWKNYEQKVNEREVGSRSLSQLLDSPRKISAPVKGD